jgi:hypothetical protein
VTEAAERLARVEELLQAARTLADPSATASQRLRRRLQHTTGLSRPSIDFALEHCLEQRSSSADLATLLARTPPATRALVLLSANVFVAPLRAIVLSRAASPVVLVRASRRDPALAEALLELVPHAFELVSELQPEAGDHLWAYGADATLAQVRAALPSGVKFHGHGFGFGAVVVDYGAGDADLVHDARAIALDTVMFDQQGCLSPRLVLVSGSPDSAPRLVQALAQELRRLSVALPAAVEPPEALAERRRFLDAATYAFEVVQAGLGFVSLSLDARLELPPAGRNLHVACVTDAAEALASLRPQLTCVAVRGPAQLQRRLQLALPGARCCELGQMQRPPLDGPVDLRTHVDASAA